MRMWRRMAQLSGVAVLVASGCALGVEDGDDWRRGETDDIEHPLEPATGVDEEQPDKRYRLRSQPTVSTRPVGADKPTPDPWKESSDTAQANPNKPTPDPWNPESGEPPPKGSGAEGSDD